jgi:hypothetical protein
LLLKFQLVSSQQRKKERMKCYAVLLLCTNAFALRAPGAKSANHSVIAVESNTTNTTASDNSAKIDDVMNSVAAMMSKMNDQPKKHHVAQANVSAGGHQKVDVGFTAFEKQLNQTLESGVNNATKDSQWTAEMRQKLLTNVTDSMISSWREKVKPIKQSIGKTNTCRS